MLNGVKVTRTVVIEYIASFDSYPDMGVDEIVDWESDPNNVELAALLELDVISDAVEVVLVDTDEYGSAD